MASETPLSVWLRRRASEPPELARALFGRTDRIPMVFQYDPCDYCIETVPGAGGVRELVVTVTRPMLSPRAGHVHAADMEAGAPGADLAAEFVLCIRDRLRLRRPTTAPRWPSRPPPATYGSDCGAGDRAHRGERRRIKHRQVIASAARAA